jgi:ferrochelatase
VFQSRSGPPTQPWLEPDVSDALQEQAQADVTVPVILCPIGFISDHMEVLFDLDEEAAQVAKELGLTLTRTKTAGTHPRFIRMIRELVEERVSDRAERLAVGQLPPSHDVCPVDCCQYEPRRPTAT